MDNPNRKITSTKNFVTKKSFTIVTISIFLAALLATIWVMYNQVTERDQQISVLSDQIVETNKQIVATNIHLKETETKYEEIVNLLSVQIESQKATIVDLDKAVTQYKETSEKLKSENAELTKKYRELVKP